MRLIEITEKQNSIVNHKEPVENPTLTYNVLIFTTTKHQFKEYIYILVLIKKNFFLHTN